MKKSINKLLLVSSLSIATALPLSIITSCNKEVKYTVNVKVEGNGTIKTDKLSVTEGMTLIQLNEIIDPIGNDGSFFVGYYVDNKEVDPTTFTISSDTTISARFYSCTESYLSKLFELKPVDDAQNQYRIHKYNPQNGIHKIVHIPSSFTIIKSGVVNKYDIVSIDDGAFDNNDDIYYVRMFNSIKTIGEHAFADCDQLHAIQLSQNLQQIGAKTFSGCKHLESIVIPNNVETVGLEAFQGCIRLKTVTFTFNSLCTSMGESAFLGCISLQSVYLSRNLVTIENMAFAGCRDLSTIQLFDNIETIGTSAFMNCQCLRNVVLPKKLTEISNALFYNCVSLRSVQIPTSIKTIDVGAFLSCPNLTDKSASANPGIIYTGDMSEWKEITRPEEPTYWHTSKITQVQCIDGKCGLDE